MHDERWVDRFTYIWNRSLYYEPLDTDYEPEAADFLGSLSESQRATFTRDGIWWHHPQPGTHLPEQGWKIHISASPADLDEVVRASLAYLLEHGLAFKIALDRHIHTWLNSKRMARSAGGKLITVYPSDIDSFRTSLADLARILDGLTGPFVLSDCRYRDCETLYFRYGQFTRSASLDCLGRSRSTVTGPDGVVPDERAPLAYRPAWVPWPFDTWEEPDLAAGGSLLNGRYDVHEAIQFANSGGVYRATDLSTGEAVVVKEARPYTAVDAAQGMDARDLLAREWRFLNRLADTGIAPRPIDHFRQGEHTYLVEEEIEGADLREALFEHNPLIRVSLGPDGAEPFLKTFLDIFSGLLVAVMKAHERQVVLGDLSPVNVLLESTTGAVRVIDLEACRLTAATNPEDADLVTGVRVATPGFSHSQVNALASAPADDGVSIASVMGYVAFPVTAMSFLRPDMDEVTLGYVRDLGWPPEIGKVLAGLWQRRISLAAALEQLQRCPRVATRPSAPIRMSRAASALVADRVAGFVVAAADSSRDSLFPVDPFAHETNPLGLGFGALGVMWALHEHGLPMAPAWREWVVAGLAAPARRAPGLINGDAGMAWAAADLGLIDESRRLLARAEAAIEDVDDHSYYYGLAGIGLAALRQHLRDGNPSRLDAARRCAQRLEALAVVDSHGARWRNEFADESPLTGLGYGPAGVALFLLRLSQVTGDQRYRWLGRRALDAELADATSFERVAIAFVEKGTVEPYLEVGSAGVAQVLLRYGELDLARQVLDWLHVRHTVLPGYIFGLAGLAEVMLDAAERLHDIAYRHVAAEQLHALHQFFLFDPGALHGVRPLEGTLAVPGEGLLRCATDLGTGSAGVLHVLHRYATGSPGSAFMLDELDGLTRSAEGQR